MFKQACSKGHSVALSAKSPAPREDGSSSHSSISEGEQPRDLQDTIKYRILHLLEQLRVEKASRDANTMGYLQLVAKADRHQASHIRRAFEKVNQRTSATIALIERRLLLCHQQLYKLEDCGRRAKQMGKHTPRDVGTGLRLQNHTECVNGTEAPDRVQPAQRGQRMLLKMTEELQEVKKLQLGLQASYQSLKHRRLSDLQVSLETLQEQRYRQVSIGEQADRHLQGYAEEMSRLKQSLTWTEENMVYLSYERAKEVWEVIEIFQSRITKLEVLQQATQLELTHSLQSHSLLESVPRALSLFTLMAVVLLLAFSMCASFQQPSWCLCTCTALLLLLALGVLIWQAWVPSKWRLFSREPRTLPSAGEDGHMAWSAHSLPPGPVLDVQKKVQALYPLCP